MSHLKKTFLRSLVFLAFATATLSAAEPFSLRANEVVAFLGGTNAVNIQNAGYLETSLTLSAVAQPRFIDLAWEGDTVYRQGTVVERWRKEKFGDLAEQLKANKVTTVVLMFGANEVLGGSNVDDFAEAIDHMISLCVQGDCQAVVVTPIPFEKTSDLLLDLSQRNADLAKYVAAMSRVTVKHHGHFVDLFQHFSDRKTEKLTSNGLHIRPAMHEVVSKAIASQLGTPTENFAKSLQDAISKKHRLWMSYWRPANWKCLFGDDGERNFGKATGDSVSLREEWKQLPNLIAKSEHQIWNLAKASKSETKKAKP